MSYQDRVYFLMHLAQADGATEYQSWLIAVAWLQRIEGVRP